MVTDYHVYWDQGTGTWTSLATSTSGATSYTQTSLISAGSTYEFKIAAVNAFGEGP